MSASIQPAHTQRTYLLELHPLRIKLDGRGWRMQDFVRRHIYLFIYLHILTSFPAYKMAFVDIMCILLRSSLNFGIVVRVRRYSNHLTCICLRISLFPTVYLFTTYTLTLIFRFFFALFLWFMCTTLPPVLFLCRTIQDCIHCFYTYFYSLIAQEPRYLLARTFRAVS